MAKEPRVKTTATIPIRVGQVWHLKNPDENSHGRAWTVEAVGPEFCLLIDHDCESHLITKVVNVAVWSAYFDELLKGF